MPPLTVLAYQSGITYTLRSAEQGVASRGELLTISNVYKYIYTASVT